MPAFHRASVAEFVASSESELTGILSVAYAVSGFTSLKTAQTRAWIEDVLRMQETLSSVIRGSLVAAQWTILLEFTIPRKEKRIDVVLLTGDTIVILELKSSEQGAEADRQAEEYALLLHYFHRPSHERRILTFVVTPNLVTVDPTAQMFLPIVEAPAYWIMPVEHITWSELSTRLLRLSHNSSLKPIDPYDWENGEYHPVPTIIDAARSLQSGLSVREIAHSRAARHDVDRLTSFVDALIEQSRTEKTFSICFVTGVPGSGKTLVGLNLAFAKQTGRDSIHFMSGTGPLIQVLQAVLARHYRETTGARSLDASIFAKTLIENVHVFAKEYSERDTERAPSNHVIIFDEAQRAWDRAQNLSKFKRPYSEPEMLLKIMGRHDDWAVVIALVGGGQEINSGEAGLEEWGRALTASSKTWNIYASSEALVGGPSVAGSALFEKMEEAVTHVHETPQLHLDVAVRSLKAESYSAWVNHVVRGEAHAAFALKAHTFFPIYLTRSLQDARALLRENTRGESRCGLVGSSGAMRLRADGLEPDSSFHAEYPWAHWYLGERTDVRSSYQLEVFATEFEIQGLELDWIGLCWGGDYIWSAQREQWVPRAFRHGQASKWSENVLASRQVFRQNAYRVLLTRARQGIVLYVPRGDPDDSTRSSVEFDETADFLELCGAQLPISRL